MKRITLLISAAFLLLAGCAKEQLVDERSYAGSANVVKATFESLTGDSATKAAVTDAGTFTWQNGDQAAFAVCDASESYVKGTNSSTSATAIFELEKSVSFSSSSWAIYPFDLTTKQTPASLKVKVPASRVWAQDQTNVAMYGVKETSSNDFNFFHMGGLVRIEVNNVPTNARKFVFKASEYKINGEFIPVEESDNKVIKTETSENEAEQTYTLTLTTAPSSTNKTVFYVPLPVGEYKNGFAFYLKDGEDNILYSKVGTTSQPVARKQLLLMPAINLVGGSIEPAVKAAVVQEVPAGHSGDFLLANSEKVLLKVNASEQNKDITLKYNGGDLPTNLEIQVVGGRAFDKTISGNLPKTHVDFTTGEIANVEMTTSASTFEIVYPAKISTKLTVKGGNVKVKGAQVAAIEVAVNAKADGGTAPVEIVVDKAEVQDFIAPVVTAKANVIVAPAASVEVKVTVEGEAKVANGGEGTVKDNNEQPIATKAAAKIGDIKYITLADAVKAAPANATEATTITLLENVTDGAGIFLAATDKKNIIIDLNDKAYTAKSPAVGSEGYKTQAFHFEKDNTVFIKNGEINIHADNKDKTWTKESGDKGIALMIQNYANLTLEDVTIDASNIAQKGTASTEQVRYAVSTNHGSTTFAGKTKIITVGDDIAFDSCDGNDVDYPGKPTVTWSCSDEGSVTGGIELSGGNFVVETNLSVSAPVLAAEGESTLEIGTGATLSPATNFSDLNPNISNHATGTAPVQVKRGASLTICGDGVVDSKTVVSAVIVTVKGDDSSKTAKLTVNGKVTLQGKYYGISGNGDRQNTEITVKGGNIKGTEANDCAGIYHPQSGSLNISGGTIEGAVGIYVKAGTVSTSVEGGEIKGTGIKKDYSTQGDGFVATGDAIVFDNCDYPGGAPNATINGGTFTSKNGLAVASYAKEGVEGGPIKPVIKGGTFSDLSGVQYVAEGTYKLANNVTLATPLEITSGKTFTIDLNSKTLTGRTNIAGANVTFTNGKIAGGNNQAINIYGSETSAENYSVVNISNNVEVSADVYAVCVFGKYNGVGVGAGTTGYGAVANIAGTIKTTGDEKNGAVFVSGNLGAKSDSEWAVSSKNAVNIKSTAKITSEKDAALALNGSATVTVEAGAQLTGATAIAAKRGKLIVNGGTITGTMDPGMSNPATFMNGTEMTGSAVSATASYKADGPLSVEIKDGTFTSKAYTILNNHDECEFKIYGGNFTTTMATDGIAVYARLGSVNITSGEFTNNSNSEATLHVGCPAAVTGNKTPYLTISGSPTVKNNADGPYTWGQQGSAPLTVNMANELTYKAVNISGGTFHGQNPEKDDSWTPESDAHKYFLAEGYEAKESTTGVWTVSAKNN